MYAAHFFPHMSSSGFGPDLACIFDLALRTEIVLPALTASKVNAPAKSDFLTGIKDLQEAPVNLGAVG